MPSVVKCQFKLGKLIGANVHNTAGFCSVCYYLSCPERFHVLRVGLTCRLHIGEPVDEVAGVQVSPVFRTNLHLEQTARATCEPHLELSLPFSLYRTVLYTPLFIVLQYGIRCVW